MNQFQRLQYKKGLQNPMKKPEQEGAICEMTPQGLVVSIYYRHPTENEMESLSPGKPFQIGLFRYEELIFILLNLNDEIVLECPYNASLYPYAFTDMNQDKNKAMLIHVILTDFDTNIVQAVRVVSSDYEFDKYFFRTAGMQYRKGLSTEKAAYLQKKAYEKYSTGTMSEDADFLIQLVGA